MQEQKNRDEELEPGSQVDDHSGGGSPKGTGRARPWQRTKGDYTVLFIPEPAESALSTAVPEGRPEDAGSSARPAEKIAEGAPISRPTPSIPPASQPPSSRGEAAVAATGKPTSRSSSTERPSAPGVLRDTMPPPRVSLPAALIPGIEPPPNVIEHPEGRVWFSAALDAPLESARGRVARLGCYSHRGPEWTWADKENEDFAFAVTRKSSSGEVWALAGVCDGVSGSTWCERGAKHGAAAFLEVVTSLLLDSPVSLEVHMQSPAARREFAEAFCRALLRRFEADVEELVRRRCRHPSWAPDLYDRKYLLGEDAAEKRMEWFQTTLLAAALGPHGGFALLMGDGYVGVDRKQPDRGLHRKSVQLQRDDRRPELCLKRWITPDDVLAGLRGVPLEQSSVLGVVLGTDGVSKTPANGLDSIDQAFFKGMDDCQAFVEALANRKTEVESDNMSVAFARQETV